MVERLIHIIKHGLTVKSSTNTQGWDDQLPRVLFGYWCGIYSSTKYSPYMVLIGHNPCLIVNNSLNILCVVVNKHVRHEAMAKEMINKT